MNPSSALLSLIKESDNVEFLITINWGYLNSRQARKDNIHPAKLPGAIRLSTGANTIVEDASGKSYFFRPSLLDFPIVETSLDPVSRQVAQSQVTMKISSAEPLKLFNLYNSFGGWLHIDVWSPGAMLEEVYPIFSGQITASQYHPEYGGMSIEAQDGEVLNEARFPPSDIKLSRAIFPNIPFNVDGRYNRQIAFGAVSYPIMCPQVDNGRLFYVLDNEILPGTGALGIPFRVTIQGVSYASSDPKFGWDIVRYTPSSNYRSIINTQSPMTLIQFKNRITTDSAFVTAEGFYGIGPGESPMLNILTQYGGFIVEQSSTEIIKRLDEEMSIFISDGGSPLIEIMRDRIFMQTKYMMGFRLGEIKLFNISGNETNIHISRSHGIISDENDYIDTGGNPEKIINSVEVGYQRNIYSQSEIDTTRQSYFLSAENAGQPLANLLQSSVAFYGQRYRKIDCPDVVATTKFVPRIVLELAESTLRVSALQHRPYKYKVPYWPGITIQENAIIYVTDDLIKVENKRMRVVRKMYEKNIITLELIDEFN